MLDRLSPAPFVLLGAAAARVGRGLRATACAARRAFRRHHERQYLAEMDARMLRDIGADPMIAWREARKWWWQG